MYIQICTRSPILSTLFDAGKYTKRQRVYGRRILYWMWTSVRGELRTKHCGELIPRDCVGCVCICCSCCWTWTIRRRTQLASVRRTCYLYTHIYGLYVGCVRMMMGECFVRFVSNSVCTLPPLLEYVWCGFMLYMGKYTWRLLCAGLELKYSAAFSFGYVVFRRTHRTHFPHHTTHSQSKWQLAQQQNRVEFKYKGITQRSLSRIYTQVFYIWNEFTAMRMCFGFFLFEAFIRCAVWCPLCSVVFCTVCMTSWMCREYTFCCCMLFSTSTVELRVELRSFAPRSTMTTLVGKGDDELKCLFCLSRKVLSFRNTKIGEQQLGATEGALCAININFSEGKTRVRHTKPFKTIFYTSTTYRENGIFMSISYWHRRFAYWKFADFWVFRGCLYLRWALENALYFKLPNYINEG